MSNEKEYEKDNVTLDQAAAEIAKHKDRILEDFTKAYLIETGLKPSQVELVSSQRTENGTIETVYYFREKK